MVRKIVGIIMLLAGILAGTRAAAQEYTLKFMIGVVEVKKADGAWVPAALDAVLTGGDSLRTAAESRAELADASGRLVSVGEAQALGLGDGLMSADGVRPAEKKNLRDRWRVLTGAPSSARDLSSPTAVAAIRGKAADGFTFTDVDGDGIDDNLLADDNSALVALPLGIDAGALDDRNFIEVRGRHGIHNDIPPDHTGSGHLHP
jgi:hypothetical protein